MASRFLIKIYKFNLTAVRQAATKNSLVNPLRPRTPEDEYRDMFIKTMGSEYLKHTNKQLEKLNKRTSQAVCGDGKISWKGSNCGKKESAASRDGSKKESPASRDGCKKESKCGEPKTMRALVLDVQTRKIEPQNVLIPTTLKKDEVTIQVRYSGKS